MYDHINADDGSIDTEAPIATIRAGDSITFGDRKMPLEVDQHSIKIDSDGVTSFRFEVEGPRGGVCRLLWRRDRYTTETSARVERLARDGVRSQEWEADGRVDLSTITIEERGDYEPDATEAALLEFDIGDSITIDTTEKGRITGTVDRFELSGIGPSTMWVVDDDQDHGESYGRNSLSILSRNGLNENLTGRYHPPGSWENIERLGMVSIVDDDEAETERQAAEWARSVLDDDDDDESDDQGETCEFCGDPATHDDGVGDIGGRMHYDLDLCDECYERAEAYRRADAGGNESDDEGDDVDRGEGAVTDGGIVEAVERASDAEADEPERDHARDFPVPDDRPALITLPGGSAGNEKTTLIEEGDSNRRMTISREDVIDAPDVEGGR